MKRMQINKRFLNRLLIIILSIFTLLSAVIIGLRFNYRYFYKTAQREFLIPALSGGFVPQGFTYSEKEYIFLISGYITGSKEAKVIITKPDGSYRILTVLDEQGKVLISHMGGIGIHEEYVYMAGCNGICYVLSSEELIHGDSDKISVVGSFKTGNEASFCFVSENSLYVGEYYYNIKFKTDEDHQMTTPTGDANKALMLRFELDQEYPLGVDTSPDMALSTTGRIQGGCLTNNGTMVLSASSIFQGSQLYYYDYITIVSEVADIFEIEGRAIPLYYLDNDNLIETISVLPKSEGITVCNDNIYIIFESATKRFKYGKLLDAQYVYSLPLD